jgi:hypothetical protein
MHSERFSGHELSLRNPAVNVRRAKSDDRQTACGRMNVGRMAGATSDTQHVRNIGQHVVALRKKGGVRNTHIRPAPLRLAQWPYVFVHGPERQASRIGGAPTARAMTGVAEHGDAFSPATADPHNEVHLFSGRRRPESPRPFRSLSPKERQGSARPMCRFR